MSSEVVGIIGLFVMLALMFLRMPLGIAMMVAAFGGFAYISGTGKALSILSMNAYNTAGSYMNTTLPLFILMGSMAASAGLSTDAFHVAHKWVGHFRGGLAIATVGGCTGFASVCGDSVATAVTMCKVAYPEMKNYNYADQLSLGTIASGGMLGFMIPPSIAFIIYAYLTEESIGDLFIAGILPGLLIAFLFVVAIYIWCRIDPSVGPAGPKATWKERISVIPKVWGIIVLFILVLGGLYAGVFTPTEAGAAGAFGTLVLGLARRKLKWKDFVASLSETAQLTGMILILIIGSTLFSYFLAITEMPFAVANFVNGLPVAPIVIVIVIVAIYIALGFFMGIIGVIVITVPIIYPTLKILGIDAVWFGVLVVLTIMIGNITPPVAIVVFAVGGLVKDVPLHVIFQGVWPFLYSQIVAAILIIAFPQIALYPVNLMKPG